MSVLGAQIPLSTFARTDPDVAGYGLGADAELRVDADRRLRDLPGDRRVHAAADHARCSGRAAPWWRRRCWSRVGYALWLPFHDHTWQALINMAVAGLGSGALVAALPATAAAAAPPERTGFATGMTNATKTIGGAIASAVFAIALSATGSLDDPEEGHAAAVRLPHGLDDLRGRRPARRRRAADAAQARRRGAGAGAPARSVNSAGQEVMPDARDRRPARRAGPAAQPRRRPSRRGRPDPAPEHLGGPADPAGAGARRVRQPARRRQADRGPRRRARPGLVAQEARRARADRRTPAAASRCARRTPSSTTGSTSSTSSARYAATSRTSTSA